MNRVWEFIPWPSSRSERQTLRSLKTSVGTEIKKTEKKVRRRLTDEERKLRDHETRQERLDRERRRTTNAEKKLTRERALRDRLLSDDEKISLIHQLETEAMSDEQRQTIEKKLRDSKLETSRRKRQTKFKPSNAKKQKINKKYSDLDELLKGGIDVKKIEDIADGSSMTYMITSRNPTKVTVSDFLNKAKIEALKLMSEFSNNFKLKLRLETRLKKSRLLNDAEVSYTDMHTSSNYIILNSSLDLDKVYDQLTSKILNVYLKKEHEGSGWTLDRIKGLELVFYDTK